MDWIIIVSIGINIVLVYLIITKKWPSKEIINLPEMKMEELLHEIEERGFNVSVRTNKKRIFDEREAT